MPHTESGAPYTLSHPSNKIDTPTAPIQKSSSSSDALEYLLEQLNKLPLVRKGIEMRKTTKAPHQRSFSLASEVQKARFSTSYRKTTTYKEKMRHYEDVLNMLFDTFRYEFQKTYDSKHEHERRKNIYRHNMRYVAKFFSAYNYEWNSYILYIYS